MAPPARLDDLIAYVHAQEPDGDPLAQLTAAVQAGQELGELADHLIGHFVDQARRAGASWTDIGQSMGVTKQAAQKRFVPRAEPEPVGATGRFQRFTPRARHVVVAAENLARSHGNPGVTTEHLTVALVDERAGIAAQALDAQGVGLDELRERLMTQLGPSVAALPEHLPFSPGSKKLLERTLREALLLGHNYIGTEHILLALLGDGDVPATKTMVEVGVDPARTVEWIRSELTRLSSSR